ncbi:glycosyl hydrolase family 18 protein [Chitinophaga arvensicola]|uniref:chitinase n=1 Tax=Chitinophaga arvensicola TaxID=29529 RepID=A0A1I0S7Y4_9BACT|nr:glycosyl hydrolase family 18 protein [Chitinophaga arvensicola]SEW51767.1 Por secretion system C-terminal sorting domain-containing protein [Chitinophaga arvensicola]
MKPFLKLLAILLVFALNTTAQTPFRVIGYMPSWAGNVNQVQYSKLTHINYAFLLPTSTGGLQAIDNPAKLQSLVSTAHANNVKVLISVGGWNNGDDSGFESLAANGTYRNNFVTNMINFVNQYGLDGVDIDWEYPDAGASANNYVTLMTQLSTEMHNRGKLLTGAIVGTGGASILNSAFALVDFYNLMAYDYNNFDHSTYTYASQSVSYWRGRGLPASKTVLGVPFYGRPTWESYAQLVARGANPYADVFDNVGYNGITTIKQKTNLAFDQGSGVMIWELSQDVTGANSLLSAIHDVVVTRTGNPGGNAPIGQTIWLRGNNNLYVSSENGTQAMNCNRTSAQGWEQFTVVDAGGGKIALRSQGKYVSSENGAQPITCNRTSVQDWEKFTWITNSNGTISLQGNNGGYLCSENGTQAMSSWRTTIGTWESFNYGAVSGLAALSATTAAVAETHMAVAEEAAAINVYPNPVPGGGTFTVTLPHYNPKAPVKASLISAGMQPVIVQQPNARTFTISTGHVAGGAYVLEVQHDNKRYVKKIIIQ